MLFRSRALLARHQGELKLFRATARLPGFAQQLSQLLRELQQHQLRPQRLETLATRVPLPPQLGDKLQDVGLILRAYLDWLRENRIQDVNCLLDLAAATLRQVARESGLLLGGLWLDGFGELSPQEIDLLSALMPCCEIGRAHV